jgi:hypothetical protein
MRQLIYTLFFRPVFKKYFKLTWRITTRRLLTRRNWRMCSVLWLWWWSKSMSWRGNARADFHLESSKISSVSLRNLLISHRSPLKTRTRTKTKTKPNWSGTTKGRKIKRSKSVNSSVMSFLQQPKRQQLKISRRLFNNELMKLLRCRSYT